MLELIFALLLAALPANYPAASVVESQLLGDSIVSVHADASVSSVTAMAAEKVLVCSVADAAGDASTGDPIPNLTTSWKDQQGGTHTVSTPIPSATPAGQQRAVQQHRELVGLMQQVYPPATS